MISASIAIGITRSCIHQKVGSKHGEMQGNAYWNDCAKPVRASYCILKPYLLCTLTPTRRGYKLVKPKSNPFYLTTCVSYLREGQTRAFSTAASSFSFLTYLQPTRGGVAWMPTSQKAARQNQWQKKWETRSVIIPFENQPTTETRKEEDARHTTTNDNNTQILRG